jgi:hypothetical protein
MWRDGTVYDAQHLAQQGTRGLRGAIQSIEQQSKALENAAKKHSVKRHTKRSIVTANRGQKTPAVKAA